MHISPIERHYILKNRRLSKQEAVRNVLRCEKRGDQVLHAARFAAMRPE